MHNCASQEKYQEDRENMKEEEEKERVDEGMRKGG
jgi:hypothetical protein